MPPTQRVKTDESLSAERAKTDQSLATIKVQTELKADLLRSEERLKADEAREIARREGAAAPGVDVKAAEIVQERLEEERQGADAALAQERRRMDEGLVAEREHRRAVEATLLKRERKETDRDLSAERRQIDDEVAKVERVLSKEKAAHSATQAALTTRDEFLAIVSHDLKNPLGAVAMAVDALSTTGALSDPEAREYVEVIGRSAREALRLIDDLLDIEQMAAGKFGLRIGEHDIDAIVRQTAHTFDLRASAAGLELAFSGVDGGLPAHCDPARVTQILTNLLANAVKFTRRGGKVQVSVAPVPGMARITVSDNGPGIPENMRQTVFERFWQLHNHDRRGLGLGLYIAKMLVESHGGHIWVESTVGVGSTFHFTIPTVG